LHESEEWTGIDTAISAGLFSSVSITIESTLYWEVDIELLALQIKEWEQISRSSGINIAYYRIFAVTKCPKPEPCTSPSWWCSHPDDVGPIVLSPYEIREDGLLEVLRKHVWGEN